MDHFEIWDIVSMAWTEVGLDDKDYPEIARRLSDNYDNWHDIDEILFRDVCLSFSFESATMLFAIIPLVGLFLISPLPDWGYGEEYLKKRIKRWYSKPFWFHLLNPLRIIGYPIALYFVLGLRGKLKRSFIEAKIIKKIVND